ncbi:MAG: substrate-binding domain-containing protein, partial [Chloroflexi bacterium]|nr:substrate-binding domain-containing protein [Chloroflexota bacterium]
HLHNAAFISQPQLLLAEPSLINHQSMGSSPEPFETAAAALNQMLEQYSGMPHRASGVSVRIAALKRDDGSMVVAIESMGLDGRWSSRQLPQRRVLSAEARSGAWLASSAVELPGATEQAPLFCVVTHGSDQDLFWQLARAYMHISAHVTDTNWRFEPHLDGADQAAAIDQCSADGAVVIASTLADPDAVTDSLLAAKQAGARIVTFNSGARFADAAGSEIHVTLDDPKAGATAGIRINELGVTGTVACIVHEAGNVGLEERCEGLESTYTGAGVTRLHLTEGAADEQVIRELVAGLTDPDSPDIELVLTLNANTLFNALAAVDQIYADSGHAIKVVPIGTHAFLDRTPLETRRRHLVSPFNDSTETQGFLALSAMHFVHNNPTPPEFIGSSQLWLATPYRVDPSRLRTDRELARGVLARLLRYVAESVMDDE